MDSTNPHNPPNQEVLTVGRYANGFIETPDKCIRRGPGIIEQILLFPILVFVQPHSEADAQHFEPITLDGLMRLQEQFVPNGWIQPGDPYTYGVWWSSEGNLTFGVGIVRCIYHRLYTVLVTPVVNQGERDGVQRDDEEEDIAPSPVLRNPKNVIPGDWAPWVGIGTM
ncbi:hypothetical protein BDW59DRAFT_160838 [Aspergillus cavernicola]|uniref:Uncharacterized protein n=1 Tax=Aspergillus cavernicola TaxID=176166 RepID=A0ABR4IFV5_9EURO